MPMTGVLDPEIGEIAARNAIRGGYYYNLDKVTATAAKAAVFDGDHAVFTTNPIDNASQSTTGDNSGGLQDPLHLEPMLTYAYTRGYSTHHETSQGITVSVEQDVDYEFLGVGGSTKITVSGSVSWTQGTSEDKTTSVSSGGTFPFDVPRFKIYEEKLLLVQETVAVPYKLDITIAGPVEVNDFSDPASDFFNVPGGRWPPPPYKDVDWSDFESHYWDGTAHYILHGTLTAKQGSDVTVKVYDITNGGSQEVTAAGGALVRAAYDPSVPIGVHHTMNDAGGKFLDTPFDDWVDGGAGHDSIRFLGGEDIAYGGGGDDTIRAAGVGRSVLDGGEGDDIIALTSNALLSNLIGGEGDDRIRAFAPYSMVEGGAGDDRFFLQEATSGGSVITDAEGRNRLEIDTCAAPGFERVGNSDNLYILLGGGEAYIRDRDVVWVDFFANPDNRVNGLWTSEVADRTVTFVPPVPGFAALAGSASADQAFA